MRRFALAGKQVLLIGALLALIAGGMIYYYEAIPTRDWNAKALRQLERIAQMKPDSLTFTVLGDNRGNLAVYDRLLDAVNREPGVCFAIHMGDMVDTGQEQTFRTFLKHTRDRLDLPMITVMGNHEKGEGGRALYDTVFNPAYYSFAIKDCYFIIMDDAIGDSLTDKQITWLAGELKKAEAFQHRLVFMHIPPFDPRGKDWSHCLSPKKAAPLKAMFKQHGVTHLFAGHIHGYYEGEWEGMHYVVTGGAGADFTENDPDHNFYHYLLVNVEEGQKPKISLCRLPV